MVAEITATFWDYPGQVLRSFTINEKPSQLYSELHAAADAAFDAITKQLKAGAMPAEVIEASRVIEDSGFTIIDDLLHGYGGGYLPPILGCTNRPAGPLPKEPFRAGQTIVVQPNVVTTDHSAEFKLARCCSSPKLESNGFTRSQEDLRWCDRSRRSAQNLAASSTASLRVLSSVRKPRSRQVALAVGGTTT